MALAEAVAHGLPVVSTTAGAIPETVPAGAGVLVPPGDSRALAKALASTARRSAARRELAADARAARATLPTWRGAADKFAAALDGLGGHGVSGSRADWLRAARAARRGARAADARRAAGGRAPERRRRSTSSISAPARARTCATSRRGSAAGSIGGSSTTTRAARGLEPATRAWAAARRASSRSVRTCCRCAARASTAACDARAPRSRGGSRRRSSCRAARSSPPRRCSISCRPTGSTSLAARCRAAASPPSRSH